MEFTISRSCSVLVLAVFKFRVLLPDSRTVSWRTYCGKSM